MLDTIYSYSSSDTSSIASSQDPDQHIMDGDTASIKVDVKGPKS